MLVSWVPLKSVFMNQDLSQLNLTELHDRLSDFTAEYSKSMLNGLTEKEFRALQAQIEQLQKEIAERKKDSSSPGNNTTDMFPPPKSATA